MEGEKVQDVAVAASQGTIQEDAAFNATPSQPATPILSLWESQIPFPLVSIHNRDDSIFPFLSTIHERLRILYIRFCASDQCQASCQKSKFIKRFHFAAINYQRTWVRAILFSAATTTYYAWQLLHTISRTSGPVSALGTGEDSFYNKQSRSWRTGP